MARLWIVVALFAAVTVVWSAHVGIPIRDPHGSILVSRIAISLSLFVPLSVLDAVSRLDRPQWSWQAIVPAWKRRWPLRRFALAMAALLAYHLVYFCYHNLKSWDVLNTPRDDLLQRWDVWLFLGHTPAALLHQLLGENIAAYLLMGIYESFSTLVCVVIVASLVFPTRLRDGYVFIASLIWVWILGVACYYLIPSLGPFDYAPQDFAGLPHTMVQDTQDRYMAQRAHLLAHPEASDAFAQVSAFASLHVGLTCVIWLMARYYELRRLSQGLLVYLVGTIIATVYLGWHFALDNVAGLVIAWLAVLLGRLTIYPRGRPTQAFRFFAGLRAIL